MTNPQEGKKMLTDHIKQIVTNWIIVLHWTDGNKHMINNVQFAAFLVPVTILAEGNTRRLFLTLKMKTCAPLWIKSPILPCLYLDQPPVKKETHMRMLNLSQQAADVLDTKENLRISTLNHEK